MRSRVIGNNIYGFEPYFGKLVRIAVIDHENREVRPTHGYFYPHEEAKFSKRIAKKLGYHFNNN